jgi:cation transport protein ChaC
MPLSRDSLTDDSFKQAMLDEAPGEMTLMDEAAFEASRQAILDRARETGELWVFGYGSLIWNPIVEIDARRTARLPGHSRRFCVWAPIGRGTPERPGLWLALDEGGDCEGVALRIPSGQWDAETLILWRREMISGVYRPAWLTLETADGPLPCCVFLSNPAHDRYQAEIDHGEKVEAIAKAAGSLGPCRDYLYDLAAGLRDHGQGDAYIDRLERDVRAAAGDT